MDTNGHPVTTTPSHRLLLRINDPRTVEALERLLDRLDLVAFAVEATDGFFRRGEQIVENVGDALHDVKAATPKLDPSALTGQLPQLAAAGATLADIIASPGFVRLLNSGLLERLTNPEIIAALMKLFEKLPLLVFVADAMDGFLRRGEQIAENVADCLQEARHCTPPIDPQKLREVFAGLPKVIDGVTTLIHAGMFDPQVVAVLAEVGKQAAGPYQEAKRLPDHPVGLWGLLKALRDPDVQRALGVGLHIVKRYGQTFNRSEVSPPAVNAATG